MKARIAQQFVTRKLIPSLPAFDVKGRMLYRRPVGDLLCGCYFEDSSFDASSFAVHAFVLPLYVPTDHVHLTFGKRLGSGSGQWWDYSRDREDEVGDAVLEAIRAQGIPIFERHRDASDFFRNATALVSNPRGAHILEARAYSALRAGLKRDGAAVLAALEDELAEMDQSLAYVADMRSRALRLRRAAEQSDQAVQQILDEYRNLTIGHLNISI